MKPLDFMMNEFNSANGLTVFLVNFHLSSNLLLEVRNVQGGKANNYIHCGNIMEVISHF